MVLCHVCMIHPHGPLSHVYDPTTWSSVTCVWSTHMALCHMCMIHAPCCHPDHDSTALTAASLSALLANHRQVSCLSANHRQVSCLSANHRHVSCLFQAKQIYALAVAFVYFSIFVYVLFRSTLDNLRQDTKTKAKHWKICLNHLHNVKVYFLD